MAAIAAAGCGEDDAAPTGAVAQSLAVESPRVFVMRMAKLIDTTEARSECAQLETINLSSLTQIPCPPSPDVKRSMRDFRVLGAEEYGTGAVVDYRAAGIENSAAIVLAVATNRAWGVGRIGVATAPSVGTSDRDHADDYRRTVSAYLAAVEQRDCDAFRKVAFTDTARGGDVCEGVFAATRPLARRIARNPGTRPAYEGGNETYGFFTFETRRPKPRNTTLIVVRGTTNGKHEYVVLDIMRSPTSADQRRALARDDQNPTMMSPSRKSKD